jgi:PPOX class probable FMN-dependent enzyme
MAHADDLRGRYPAPSERSLRKQLDHLDVHCRRFIELSPFVVVASVAPGDDGLPDASPRGGAPGFVKVRDPTTLLLPDAPGNNRLDTLSNVAATGRVGLLFLVPGVDETLRVNGSAEVTDADDALAPFAGERHPPRTVLRVSVHEAYLHCAKAFMRSRLWSAAAQVERSVLPTLGQMINDQIGLTTPPETHEQMLARYAKDL